MTESDKKQKAGEFSRIAAIRSRWPQSLPDMPQGIGDDAAVLAPKGSRELLVSSDLLAEDVHFTRSSYPARDIGHKSAAVNISDIAAMGGVPRWIFLSLALPKYVCQDWLTRFMQGFEECCKNHAVVLAGGDFSKSTGKITISVTIIGQAPEAGAPIMRSGAKVGDIIAVMGDLGLSRAGLEAILNDEGLPDELAYRLRMAHRRPQALTDIGIYLGESGLVHAMIDVSDGLAGDAAHIAEESNCGIAIEKALLPISDELSEFCKLRKCEPLEYQLYGGEDYALCFTTSAEKYEKLLFGWPAGNNPPLIVGRVVNESGLWLLDDKGEKSKLDTGGFDHFGR